MARTDWAQTLVDVIRKPDTAMMSATYGLSTLAICLPLAPWVPLMQSLAFLFLGDDIAGRDYPFWWASIPAGYAAYVIGFGAMAFGLGLSRVLTNLDNAQSAA
ncbi:MAG: hypothetical protein GY822_06630 [Deltaproteobacteria bacterium]|nr:hypothetical protein [Deltaproteobacteria bacterium]